MKTFLQKDYLVYLIISLCFVVLNFTTLSNLLPWCDEVMFMDTPINYLQHGSWTTTAWTGSNEADTYSVYPPLFQWIELGWMAIWGISLYAVRSLNVLVVLLAGYLILRFVKREILWDAPLSIFSVVLFTALLWGAEEFAWIYRSGRPDIFSFFFCLLALLSVWKYVKQGERSAGWRAMAWSVLSIMIGIQSAVFLVAAQVFLYLFYKQERKAIFHSALYVIGGLVVGMGITVVFFILNGHIKPFVANIVGMSATFKVLYEAVRPYLEGPLHLKPAAEREVVEQAATPGFLERFSEIFSYLCFMVMLAVNIVLLVLRRKEIARPWMRNAMVALVAFSVYIVLFMNLAGRFAIYYRWMCYLPLVIGVLVALNQTKVYKKLQYAVCGVATVVLVTIGIRSFVNGNGRMIHRDDINMDEFHAMLQSAEIPKDAHIAAPFFSFYELKNHYTHCYFPQVYPTELIKQLDYLVVYGETRYKDGFSLYGQASVINYLHELQAREDASVELVSEDNNNDIRLYRIHINN